MKTKYKLLSLLVSLNFILRIPSIPHEYYSDSFQIHILANSISEFGHAKWWVNPLAMAGKYPYSEVSAYPFILSGISQTTTIDVEMVILIFSIFLGIITAFAAYSLAGSIWNNSIFKLLVAFIFSTSPALLNYLTWTATGRAPFIGLLPIFLLCLIKIRDDLRFLFLSIPLFILLFYTHSLVYFLIPVSLGYLISIISYKLINRFRLPGWVIVSSLLLCFMGLLSIPYITGHFLEDQSYYGGVKSFFLSSIPRYSGIMAIFMVPGLGYLLLKPNKMFKEWSLLLIFISITPFLLIENYMKWFIPIFVSLIAGIGLTNMLNSAKERKHVIAILTTFLVLSVVFSGFFQHWRIGGEGITPFSEYMKESTYYSGLWMKDNMDSDSTLICNKRAEGLELFAVSKVPTFVGIDSICQAYGFFDVRELKLEERSITSDDFWYSGPYELSTSDETEIHRRWVFSDDFKDYESDYKERLGLTHVVEFNNIRGKYIWHGTRDSRFLDHVHTTNLVYNSNKMSIWNI
ncbi:MAG: hypothetical protein ACOC4Y_01180 [bacterium]